MKLEEVLVFVFLILNVETQQEQYFASSDFPVLDYEDLKTSTVLYNVRNKIRCGIICSQICTSSQTNKIMYNVDHPNITQSQCAVFNGNCYFVKKVTSCIKVRSDNVTILIYFRLRHVTSCIKVRRDNVTILIYFRLRHVTSCIKVRRDNVTILIYFRLRHVTSCIKVRRDNVTILIYFRLRHVTSCIKVRSDNFTTTCSCLFPYYGSYCHLILSSCEDVKHSMESLVNGIYSVTTIRGEIIEIFCDFQKTQIITFISKKSLSYLTTPDLMQFGSNRTRVVLRQNWINYQKDSILSQLTTHSSIPLSIYINGIGNFKEPVNTVLGEYLYLGFLNKSSIHKGSINGYATDSKDQNFSNCNNDSNSYFNFYPNLENENPSITTNSSIKVDMFAWTKTGVRIAENQKLSSDYFYVTEIHFGGCGGLTTSSIWRSVNGTALGLITDF
ncbi:hypothetical protein LOTGIDRAFT_159323 [Lottia gigantea]|uniref:EGF-like domain-containing protein n=1 Tax=Lottia gigantea TaxID=225164 RepID=V4AU49_LOTGI|nr:hypothetical protein LOTGIDRAFT_159323 [Lottia gigantea]ESO97301.1 hypothetical protein LOTGIDRAFT_159323 [Lottia gigantea]